jgi:hypothetical protein
LLRICSLVDVHQYETEPSFLGHAINLFSSSFSCNAFLGIFVLSILFHIQTIVIVSLLTLLTHFKFQLL